MNKDRNVDFPFVVFYHRFDCISIRTQAYASLSTVHSTLKMKMTAGCLFDEKKNRIRTICSKCFTLFLFRVNHCHPSVVSLCLDSMSYWNVFMNKPHHLVLDDATAHYRNILCGAFLHLSTCFVSLVIVCHYYNVMKIYYL